MPRPKFIYFDLGKVLLEFSIEQMLKQVAETAGATPESVRAALFESGLQARYETGQVSDDEFYDAFCDLTDTQPDYDALERAGSEIFELNLPMVPIVSQLALAGYRLGILSNTCASHWRLCLRDFRLLSDVFDVYALSFELKSAKPDMAIFHAAAELAGVAPHYIFFTDDIPEHVDGAKAAGFDAVWYQSAPQVAADLRKRGIEFNF